MRVGAVIVAAGMGLRAGGEIPKQFAPLGQRVVLMHTIDAFVGHCAQIVVVLPKGYINFWETLCEKHNFNTVHRVVEGGEERFFSVRNGINALDADLEVVLIHDGVRPFVGRELISRVVTAAASGGAVVPVVAVTDTLRRMGGGIVSRSEVMAVQTPQGFDAHILRSSYQAAFDGSFTDDASVVERSGHTIEMVAGEVENFKITTPYDIRLANLLHS